MRQITY